MQYIMDIIEFIKDFFQKIKNKYYNIKFGIRNLFIWFSIVWADRPYDYSFILKLLYFKLCLVQKHSKKIEDLHKKLLGHKYVSSNTYLEIDKVVELLDRIIKDEYSNKEFEPLDKRWGASEFIINKEKSSIEFIRPKIKNEEEKLEEERLSAIALKSANKKAEIDFDTFFKILSENITSWWD